MIRGLYTAASGMLAEGLRTDVIANNLANVDTVGFKRDRTIATAFPDMLIRRINDSSPGPTARVAAAPRVGRLGTGVALEGTYADMQPGALKHTGRALDVALVSDGFLAVVFGDDLAFTRDGRLQVDGEGWLTDFRGRQIVGVDGPIRLWEPGEALPQSVRIGNDGIVWVDGEQAGQLAEYRFDQPAFLQRAGDNLWLATPAAGEVEVEAARVAPEHLEASNVNVVSEMVTLIAVQRAYEANQRVIQAHDQALERAVNDIGAV